MTYIYECQTCSGTYSADKPMTAELSEPCPACGSDNRPVVTGGSGFILKGKGWPGKEMKNETR